MLRFEWDESKNIANIKKHGVSFQEAISVFTDEKGILINDYAHSQKEERFVLIGFSNLANLLVVCHCYRQNEETIRIISARKATKKESEQYVEGV